MGSVKAARTEMKGVESKNEATGSLEILLKTKKTVALLLNYLSFIF